MDEGVISCKTCNKSGRRDQTSIWHPFRHPITGMVGGSLMLPDEPPAEENVHSAAPFPFDPVLRQALIDKGVLTFEDLVEADRKIRMVSGMVSDGGGIGTAIPQGSPPAENVFKQGFGLD